MLIEFSVTNYLSFKEKQTLSMAASNYFTEMPENLIDTGIKGLPKLLSSAAIYGPNASGKSNFMKALYFMGYMVVVSSQRLQEGQKLDVVPFLLASQSRQKESEFEIHFIAEGIRYQYGFSADKEMIYKEWLVAYPKGRPQLWFERDFDREKKEYIYEFGSRFLGGNMRQVWEKATRNNALFLSTAIQLNNEQLKPIFNWFEEKYEPQNSRPYGITCFKCKHDDFKKRVIDFMNSLDISIEDILIEEELIDLDKMSMDVPKELKDAVAVLKSIKQGELKNLKVEFMHKNSETGELIPFDIETQESEGTKNLFDFSNHWFKMQDNNTVLFIDEIESSLHPLVVRKIIHMLHQSNSKAQLIFTTHDTTILSQEIMRRDQIWFIERDQQSTSRLYPLSEFKVRKGESLEKAYLDGRYGAIPIIEEYFG